MFNCFYPTAGKQWPFHFNLKWCVKKWLHKQERCQEPKANQALTVWTIQYQSVEPSPDMAGYKFLKYNKPWMLGKCSRAW